MTHVLLDIHEGQVVRNLLENDLLRLLTDRGAEVMVITPGSRVPFFVERYARPGVIFRSFVSDHTLRDVPTLPRMERYEFYFGIWLCRKGYYGVRRAMWRWWGEPMVTRRAQREKALIADWGPDVVVATHISELNSRCLVAAARRQGIRTVGNLNSWDNASKGLYVRPDIVTCWSANNRDEVCRLAAYRPEQVEVIGAPAFDAYFAPGAQWSREELCSRLNLDSARPILLFATLGQFRKDIDETNPLEVLLRAIDAGQIRGSPQVVLRMHPWSRDAYFGAFMSRPDVIVSRYENYVPGLTWTPTRDEAILAGNLLRHVDVVISPGSTMCIETAIFDSPTVVPVFNEYMPEVYDAYFKARWLSKHFGRLHENNWVPIVRSGDDMVAAVNKALSDRSWFGEGRKKIRQEFLGPLDGKATERFAEVILRVASGEAK